MTESLDALNIRIARCKSCPRLVAWRKKVAAEKVRRFCDQKYWGRPVPGFGDRDGRVLILGLAPGAHGANRTGRMFTGDSSGDWLFRALYQAGFANQPFSASLNDGLRIKDCYISAVARCAPPANKLTSREVANCRKWLEEELSHLRKIKVVIALGGVAFQQALRLFNCDPAAAVKDRPRFFHGARYRIGEVVLYASYHPSQQNTFTGRLTRSMLKSVFMQARRAATV